ncbi:DUF4249 domain-containing protein [Dinghuibacter silviterrae]|uniref:Uncharacterized protein DUF4249 n=1 Tax=Dinghuibacter silviterrae TaxID=1539049 RepID=A0A4R8DR66_9BACT|nr:DUF4249 domain-containing protein [Dinghuibacter silviterrae]TDX00316.1 uncharacterized protein DUF4249 [Dinghuibacter silviterrae]
MKRFWIISAIFLAACVKPYSPKLNNPATGYLVVEGNINAGTGPSMLVLSRTVALTDTTVEVFEPGATVALEGSDGSSYAATAGTNGTYAFGALPLDTTKTYRLDIKTTEGSEYQSDYVHVIPNVPIDSVTFVPKGGDGMYVQVNTHNPRNDTRYYQWSYDETWEYHSAEFSSLRFDSTLDTVVARLPSQQIYTCWRTDSSSNILIYSTTKLSQDVVSGFPLTFIPQGDQRLGIRYSINVHQYALSADCYNYLLLMQSNTENLGSIFDPLPSNLKGNLHCLNNPSEPVIGFVNVSSDQPLRTFTGPPSFWQYQFVCIAQDTMVPFQPAWMYLWYFKGIRPNPYPRNYTDPPSGIYIPIAFGPGDTWTANHDYCIDCRLQGGTTTQPWFWQ